MLNLEKAVESTTSDYCTDSTAFSRLNCYHETAMTLIKQFGFNHASTVFSIQFVDVRMLTLNRMNRFIHQYLTEKERTEYECYQRPSHFVAKRIASKMAFFDIYQGAHINGPDQLEIEHDQNGCPYFAFRHSRLNYILSVSDEAHMVAALCCKSF